MKMKANIEIRNALKKANLKQWQLADILKISESTLVIKLRHELPEEEKEEILKIIEENKKRGF